ncbi:unnamed protein product [Rangifer tarandus platyrhynchus]|uniref:Uncharacterized protein n=2 Tax=Rangifer tarandus platyrhynchus TaxID=3082113 RepID=A0AC59Y2K8_RANTA|nr:unnamed protein product [Rangifer tarandus platyrhynchus]
MATFEKVLQKNACHRAAVLCSQKSGDFKHLFSCGLFSLLENRKDSTWQIIPCYVSTESHGRFWARHCEHSNKYRYGPCPQGTHNLMTCNTHTHITDTCIYVVQL